MLRMAGAERDGIVGTAPRPSLVSLAGSDLKSSSSSSWHGRLRKERTSSTGSNSWHAGIGIDLGASAGSSVSDPLEVAPPSPYPEMIPMPTPTSSRRNSLVELV